MKFLILVEIKEGSTAELTSAIDSADSSPCTLRVG